MKDTNEIEKQLQHKADKYIEQKAKEMFEIHREIAMYLGGKLPNYIDYITDFNDYSKDLVAKQSIYTLRLILLQQYRTSSSTSYVKTTKTNL